MNKILEDIHKLFAQLVDQPKKTYCIVREDTVNYLIDELNSLTGDDSVRRYSLNTLLGMTFCRVNDMSMPKVTILCIYDNGQHTTLTIQ